jgi:sigma-B regulation protein RsbU (phosphoserine phosphatase)
MKKILVIEDDEVISKMYEIELLCDGYKTLIAGSGAEGIEIVMHEEPALILLDIQMPVMDGVETLKHIRNLPNGKDVPVLVITNIGQDERLKDFAGLNISGYIVKSDFTPQEVCDKILAVLEQTHAEKEE